MSTVTDKTRCRGLPVIKSLVSAFARMVGDRRGGVALYAAFAGTLLIGSMALGVDVGRMTVLRTQMQNAADAAALAASAQLDGLDGARARATAVAETTATDTSGFSLTSDLQVASVEFFSTYGATVTAATSDQDAGFVRVTMAPEQMNLLFAPVLGVLSGESTDSVSTLNANAVAGNDPIVCNAPPFMVCDFSEDDEIAIDILTDSSTIGRQVLMKPQGGGGFAPGNYGLLCVDGDCGSDAIGDALEAVDNGVCTGTFVETATGSKTNQIRDGINARFDTGSADPKNPARNVINYPRDSDMTSSTLVGNGIWNPVAYWLAKHGGAVLPAELANATRYQTYLYELDETFARSGNGVGNQTIYPIEDALPAGFVEIDPPGEDVPVDAANANDNDFDGVPVNEPEVDPLRRVVVAAVVQCVAQNVQGHGEHPASGYVFLFLTETVPGPPDADVYGEIIGPFNSDTSPDFHVNARLVD